MNRKILVSALIILFIAAGSSAQDAETPSLYSTHVVDKEQGFNGDSPDPDSSS